MQTDTLTNLCVAAEEMIENHNWHGAIATALTLPDICASLCADDGRTSGRKYAEWFDRYVGDRYKERIGPARIEHVFLYGSDCYALRCAFLHQGLSDTSAQTAQRNITGFRFVVPLPNEHIHKNQIGSVLQLQVDCFVRDITQAVRNWKNATEAHVLTKIQDMMNIEIREEGQPFSL